jgi:hypothetical protein
MRLSLLMLLPTLVLAACEYSHDRCVSFGAKPGTSDYIQCRAALEGGR